MPAVESAYALSTRIYEKKRMPIGRTLQREEFNNYSLMFLTIIALNISYLFEVKSNR